MKRIAVIAVWLIACTGSLTAQAPMEEERLSEMLREAASECAARLPQGSVRLAIAPEDAHPMVRQVFAEEIGAMGRSVLSGYETAHSLVSVDVRAMNSYTVSQANSSYLRTVSLSLGVLAEASREDSVLFSKEFALFRQDTLSREPAYESKDFRAGTAGSWIDGILVPAIATAAAVIIVVLLFTVRGS